MAQPTLTTHATKMRPYLPSPPNCPGLPKLFHMTSSRFSWPKWEASRDALYGLGDDESKHAKGILGLWLSPSPESCVGFGNHCAEVELHPGFRPIVYPLESLYAHHRELSWNQGLSRLDQLAAYTGLRDNLKEIGDVLFIADANGIGEVVVLNYEVITSFEYVDFKARQDCNWAGHPIPKEWLDLPANRRAALVRPPSPLAKTAAPALLDWIATPETKSAADRPRG